MAVALVTGAGGTQEGLRAVRGRLAAVHDDEATPAAAREALHPAFLALDAALAGSMKIAVALDAVAGALEQALEGAAARMPAARPSHGGQDALTTRDPAAPDDDATVRSPATSGDPGPAAITVADAARELFPEFMQESLDYLAQAESALLALEGNAAAAEHVHDVLRAFHTIKGTSSFLGLDAIAALAHDAESLLIPVRDQGAAFGAERADLLLSAADMMRALLAHAQAVVVEGARPALPDAYVPLRERMGAVFARRPSAEQEVPAAMPSPAPSVARPADHHAADEWARVRTARLDQLVDLVGELIVAQSMVAQDPLVVHERHGPLAARVLQTSKLVRELQSVAIGLRMVPLRPLFQRMHRLVRELARQAGKEIVLVTEGDDTEIDRTLVDVLADPLVHMIRNAVDHGIESVEERRARGKPDAGTLRLSAQHAGGAVVLVFRDDGRGLDRDRILRTAVERGVVASGAGLSSSEIDGLIFAPGLSTAGTVTELSGRGVGMDAVRASVESLRGRTEIASEPGAGTTFTLRLPLTLAITDGLLVRVGAERYIVPAFSVVTSLRPERSMLVREARGGEMVMLQGRPVPIVRLHDAFGVADAVGDPCAAVLVVIAEGQQRYALLVDELLGEQQFVVKPVAAGLAGADGIAGSAVLADGRVGLIIDVAALPGVARPLPADATRG